MRSAGVFKKLSLLDRFLPVWIIGAMALGILLGYFVPAVERAFSGVQIVDVSLPIAIGWVFCSPLLFAELFVAVVPLQDWCLVLRVSGVHIGSAAAEVKWKVLHRH